MAPINEFKEWDQRVQRAAARSTLSKYRTTSVSEMLKTLYLPHLEDRREIARLKFLHSMHRNLFNFDAKSSAWSSAAGAPTLALLVSASAFNSALAQDEKLYGGYGRRCEHICITSAFSNFPKYYNRPIKKYLYCLFCLNAPRRRCGAILCKNGALAHIADFRFGAN
ncbi:unnamed protein product [Ixodes persulcatus]